MGSTRATGEKVMKKTDDLSNLLARHLAKEEAAHLSRYKAGRILELPEHSEANRRLERDIAKLQKRGVFTVGDLLEQLPGLPPQT